MPMTQYQGCDSRRVYKESALVESVSLLPSRSSVMEDLFRTFWISNYLWLYGGGPHSDFEGTVLEKKNSIDFRDSFAYIVVDG